MQSIITKEFLDKQQAYPDIKEFIINNDLLNIPIKNFIDAKGDDYVGIRTWLRDATTSTYDHNGNLIKRSHPQGDWIYEYDKHDNCTKQILPNGDIITFKHSYEYDDNNNIIKHVDIHEGSKYLTPYENIWQYEYNKDNYITKTTRNNNPLYIREYDDNNRLIKNVYSDDRYSIFEHDHLGRVNRIIYSDGTITTKYYEGDSKRVIKKTFPDDNTINLIYVYDDKHRVIKEAFSEGKVTHRGYIKVNNKFFVLCNNEIVWEMNLD